MSAEPATPELREVGGPSALGGGRSRFFELLWLMSVTEFKKTFFGTALGYLWSLVRPLMLFAVLLLVFTQVFKLGSTVPHYPVLLLFNIVLFGLFQEATGGAVSSVLAQEGIVRKTQFPRLVIPLAVVLTALFTLGLNMIVVFGFLLGFGVGPMWTWLLFPLILLPLLIFICALAMLLSALNVRFRDVTIIWVVIATALNYGTPILYPLEIVPPAMSHALMVNPLAPIFQQAHVWMIDSHAEGVYAAAGGPLPLIAAGLIYVTVCVLGVWVFNREAPRIAEQL
ncbi:MAG TPA: ABC transporter permease [Solirubrobacterales bacterium]|nr:ABC transporter permease [Solirubrobacterales bacterium]